MDEEKKPKPRRKPGQKKLMDKLEKSKKKNADARARAKVEKGSGGTLTSRMKDVRTSRGPFPVPAVRKETLPAVRKEPGRAVVPYEPPKKDSGAGMARTFAGGAARAGLRGAGPVGALIAMTGPAGEGSDKPTGPLMKGRGTRRAAATYTKPYDKAAPADKPAAPKPRPRPAMESAQKKSPAGKSATRIAFEKEFAKNRKIGRKTFKFRGGEYSTKVK